MNDKMVTLYKKNFTKDVWFTLSLDFGFNSEDSHAYIHIIIDED
ncbi:hypothetical protein [Clostridium tagluense]|uniref:Uncharacterized protein n=1 Tax=Clostridium tagluense TaxID=360422 RepID=A0A401UV29_9CLOT|nr:hypothetical protein [Clostridium tagluense]GCD13298.1 hypothetical protein Ctaglu_49210 [Clostridium tagluense]